MKIFASVLTINLLILTLSTALAQKKIEFDYFGTRPLGYKVPNLKVHCGDEIIITASGEIIVGFFAGRRTPDGVAVYSSNGYNIFKDKPHCALMVCVLKEGAIATDENYPYLGWEICGSSYKFKAKEDGSLVFSLNESNAWYRDNEPIGRGFHIVLQVPDAPQSPGVAPTTNAGSIFVGKLNDKDVYRRGDKVVYRCKQFSRNADGYWYITDDSNNDEPLGVVSDKVPYLYTFLKKNPRPVESGSGNIYADLIGKRFLFYKGKKSGKSNIDDHWYLKNEKGLCEGVVDLNGEYFDIYPNGDISDQVKNTFMTVITNNTLDNLLAHLNRNQYNLEASGRLRYLCTMRKIKALYIGFRMYYDELNCLWVLLKESESVAHRNPDKTSEYAYKFVRFNPKNTDESFESIRVPVTNESRDSPSILGQLRTYALNGSSYASYNLRDTEYRGSYNFSSSTFSDPSAIDFANHKVDDMKYHEAGYKDYMIFPEQFGKATADELLKIKALQQSTILTKDDSATQERTCPF